jgi:hypothetical protein
MWALAAELGDESEHDRFLEVVGKDHGRGGTLGSDHGEIVGGARAARGDPNTTEIELGADPALLQSFA